MHKLYIQIERHKIVSRGVLSARNQSPQVAPPPPIYRLLSLTVHIHREMKTSCNNRINRLIWLGRETNSSHESIYWNNIGKRDNESSGS